VASPSQPVPASHRIDSIDIFRGITVLIMIFVDNLGFVQGLPWWTEHMPREANGMTYVDMVFPAFLFLMGMSLPLDISSQRARGAAKSKIWARVVLRSFILVALGLFVANAPQVDAGNTGIASEWWVGLGFIGIGLVLSKFPARNRHPKISAVLTYAGVALFVVLAIIFRRVPLEGHVAWLDFSDWEILGLLGWAYLAVATIYILFETKVAVLFSAFAAFVAVNAFSVAGKLSWLNLLPSCAKPFEAGLTSITMAGLLATLLIVRNEIAPTSRSKVAWAMTSAAILFAAGWLLRPLGISKIRDTPTWCLYCIAANLLIVLLLYWIADIKHWSGWASVTGPVGRNPLLSYFLPYVAYLSPKLDWLTADGTAGWAGVAKSLFFAGMIWGAVALLDRTRIGLRV
jgi:hypothetical protein